MMEAKDTVMSHQECIKARLPVGPPYTDYERIAQAQAERTEAMLKDEWKKAGIREVVEWIESNHTLVEKRLDWQAKLKEWGIK